MTRGTICLDQKEHQWAVVVVVTRSLQAVRHKQQSQLSENFKLSFTVNSGLSTVPGKLTRSLVHVYRL